MTGTKESILESGRALLRALVLGCICYCLSSCRTNENEKSRMTCQNRNFSGYHALVIQPENAYHAYNCVVYSALLKRGMVVAYGEPEVLADPDKLEQYDIIATNIKRKFSSGEVAGLKEYLLRGGALYSNWGGPMDCMELLEVCGVKNARSVYIKEITLLDSPLTKEIGESLLTFPAWAGCFPVGKGREMVAFDQTGGTLVANDIEERCLGVLGEYGKGRTAVLGFGPENYKFITQDSKLANKLFDNLLNWLMPNGPKAHPFSNMIEISLPRRVKFLSASLNGIPVEKPETRINGSLKTFFLPVESIADGETASVRINYEPLEQMRNIEIWIHNPCAEFLKSFNSPAEAANFLSKIGATVVQPLLRCNATVCYRPCLPGDKFREKLAEYPGDYLADYITECHKRNIKVVGGLYLDWKRHPKIHQSAPSLIEKDGKSSEKKVCPLDPGVQGRNLEVVRHFLDQYPEIDALILDDNFELQNDPCHCEKCKARFHDYCERNGKNEEYPDIWKEFWKAEVKSFLARVHEICIEHRKQLGGWRNPYVDPLSREILDFHGAMVYGEPASAAHLGIRSMPENRNYITLLWGMDRHLYDIEKEFTEAVQAGSTNIGFWIQFNKVQKTEDNSWGLGTSKIRKNKFQLTPGSLDAIARAFSNAEEDWLRYYRDKILCGDPRFAIVSAELGADALTLKVKNMGHRAESRVMGTLDLGLLAHTKLKDGRSQDK